MVGVSLGGYQCTQVINDGNLPDNNNNTPMGREVKWFLLTSAVIIEYIAASFNTCT